MAGKPLAVRESEDGLRGDVVRCDVAGKENLYAAGLLDLEDGGVSNDLLGAKTCVVC